MYWPTPPPGSRRRPALRIEGELAIENGRLRLNGGDVASRGTRYADGFLELHTSFARLTASTTARRPGSPATSTSPSTRHPRAAVRRGCPGSGACWTGTWTSSARHATLSRAGADHRHRHQLPRHHRHGRHSRDPGRAPRHQQPRLRQAEPLEIGPCLEPGCAGADEVEPGGGSSRSVRPSSFTAASPPSTLIRSIIRSTSRTRSTGTSILGQDSTSLDELQAAGAGSGGFQARAVGMAGYFGEQLTRGIGEKRLAEVSIC